MENENVNNSNMIRYMSNPRAFTLKRWFIELLDKDFKQHDNTIERIAASVSTEKDLTEFGKLITTVYEKGYKKAVNDYKDQIEKLGININIVADRS